MASRADIIRALYGNIAARNALVVGSPHQVTQNTLAMPAVSDQGQPFPGLAGGVQRPAIIPLARNAFTGSVELATPAAIAEPANAINRLMSQRRSLAYDDPHGVEDALNATLAAQGAGMAGSAMTARAGARVVDLGAAHMPPLDPARFPRVDAIYPNGRPVVPFNARVIAADKPLYRETSPENLYDLLAAEHEWMPANTFVTDDPALAIGQGANVGARVEFRPNSVSGWPHKKPGTGVVGGSEFTADAFAPRAVQSVTVQDAKALRRIKPRVMVVLREFDRVDNPDGSITFTRRTE